MLSISLKEWDKKDHSQMNYGIIKKLESILASAAHRDFSCQTTSMITPQDSPHFGPMSLTQSAIEMTI